MLVFQLTAGLGVYPFASGRARAGLPAGGAERRLPEVRRRQSNQEPLRIVAKRLLFFMRKVKECACCLVRLPLKCQGPNFKIAHHRVCL